MHFPPHFLTHSQNQLISDGSVYKIYEPTEEEANKIAQDTILTLILVGTAIAVTLGVTMGVIRRKRMRS